jgi:hypothetical protein
MRLSTHIAGSLLGLATLALILLAGTGARAATVSEIVEMHNLGVPPEVIIEVIQATGLDDELDEAAWAYLVDSEVDPMVLEYLAVEFLLDGSEYPAGEDDSSREVDVSQHPNRMGGEGFHHQPTGYNPLYDSGPREDYWSQQGYTGGCYTLPGGIVVYEPPVYILDNRPYYRAWQVPRVYPHGYWDNGRYMIYDTDRYRPYYSISPGRENRRWTGRGWHDDFWGWNRGWGGFGGLYYDGRRHRWDGALDAWFHGDDFSFRISF